MHFLQRPSGPSREDSSHLRGPPGRTAAPPHQKEAGGGAGNFWLARPRLAGEASPSRPGPRPRTYCRDYFSHPAPELLHVWEEPRSVGRSRLSGCARAANRPHPGPHKTLATSFLMPWVGIFHRCWNVWADCLNWTDLVQKQIKAAEGTSFDDHSLTNTTRLSRG